MSRRNSQPQPRQPREAYYTPGAAVRVLLESLPLFMLRRFEAWECAAGAGHIARHLARLPFAAVLATDIAPAKVQVHPVTPLDFLRSCGPSGRRCAIITNPPYGFQNRMAVSFITHALAIAGDRGGLTAMLLPFEFDAPMSRHAMTHGHRAFAAKVTCGERLRWVNLPQAAAGPMSHHSWFIWCFDPALRRLIRDMNCGGMRTG